MVFDKWMFSGLFGMNFNLSILSFLLAIGLYVYIALSLMEIAKKTKTKNSWLAWIPIANFYLLTQMAGKSGLWTLVLLSGGYSFGSLLIMGVGIWLFWIIAEKIKFPNWTSLLLIIPLINLITLGVWAWSNSSKKKKKRKKTKKF